MLRLFSEVSLLIFTLCSVQAQKISIGKTYRQIGAKESAYFSEGDDILSVKITKKDVILQKLDGKELIEKKLTTYDDFPKRYQPEKILKLNHKYFFFYSFFDKGKESLIAREIDFKNGSFKNEGKAVVIADNGSGFFDKNPPIVYRGNKFEFYFSYDSSSIFIKYDFKSEKQSDNKNHAQMGAFVLNKNLDLKWNNKIKMPYPNDKTEDFDYSVDAAGNIYIETRVFNDDTRQLKKPGQKEANYHLEILRVTSGSSDVKSEKINVGDNYMQTIWLYETAEGQMVGAGYYTKKVRERIEGVDGIYVFKLDKNGKLSDQKYHEIPLEVLTQYQGKNISKEKTKDEDKDKAEYEALGLRGVIMQDDGGMMLIGEQRYSVTREGKDMTTTTYIANEILLTKIAKNGKILWMKTIPKALRSYQGFEGIDFHLFTSPSSHYFFFMDNIANKDLDLSEAATVHIDGRGGFFMMVRIDDETGEMKKNPLLNLRDINDTKLFRIVPSRMVIINSNTIVVEATKKKNTDVLVKINLD